MTSRFPSWTELKEHLTSKEGGALRVVEQEEGSDIVIIRYVKGQSELGLAGTDLFRSVIWNTKTNRPICMAPSKAREGLPPLNVRLASVEDFIDGFMVNVCIYEGGGTWGGRAGAAMATRTQIGGVNTFYSEKTFETMFNEALEKSPLKGPIEMVVALDSFLRQVDTRRGVFVSFVVQHPEHRIVAKVAEPSVHVVHMGSVDETGEVTLYEQGGEWPALFGQMQIPSYSQNFFHSETEVQGLLRKNTIQRGWRWQGLVFKDGQGGRWRLRTTTYTMLRQLRGSESSSVDRFLRLRAENKIRDYLKHYSEDREAFWKMEITLRERTEDVLKAYSAVHKAHAVAFKDLPAAYQPAVYHLHVEWRNTLRAKGFTVRIQNAIQAVNRLRPFEQRRLMDAEPYAPVVAAAPAALPVL